MSEISNKDMIYDAIVAMRDNQQHATRESLLSVLNLKRSVIDDNINTLIREGKIYTVIRGVYAPLFEHPPTRVISKTPLICGMVVVDIGNDVWTLTPQEARMLGQCFMAEAMQYSNIELGHHVAQMGANYKFETKRLEAENKKISDRLEAENKKLKEQLDSIT